MQDSSRKTWVAIGTFAGLAVLTFVLNLTISLLTHPDIGAIVRGAAWMAMLVFAMASLATWLKLSIVASRPKIVYADRESLRPLISRDESALPAYDTGQIRVLHRKVDEVARRVEEIDHKDAGEEDSADPENVVRLPTPETVKFLNKVAWDIAHHPRPE